MDDKDNKKKRKKTEEGGEEKVHKQNWRETHASTEDSLSSGCRSATSSTVWA